MSSVPLKTKNRVIVKYINGRKLDDISLEERISLSSVNDVIDEWKQGYINIDLGNDIVQEMKELASLLKEKEITVQELIEGYHYAGIFKDRERETILRIVNEISSMEGSKRKSFLNTVEKMMKLSRYKNIDYIDIPKAIEDMVGRGKELNRELKSKELQNLEMAERLSSLKKEIGNLEEEKIELSRENEISRFIRQELSKGIEDEKAIRNTIEGLKHANYSPEKIEEVADQVLLIKGRDLNLEQFLKISRYYEELMNLGLTVPMMEKILDNLKEYDVTIDEYLTERSIYVREKIAYMKSLKDLIDAHKRAEKQIKQIDEEIAKKKLKLVRT